MVEVEVEVEITSLETVKPSNPTPPHLRLHRLSWLDHQAPPSHVPFLLFFSPPTSSTAQSLVSVLKTSLSETLSLFYPLAGRLRNNSLVDCTDDGADFVEARAHAKLSHLLCRVQPDLDALGRLLPCDHSCSASGHAGALLALQVNIFDCGAVALGVCASHKVADGLSLASFVAAWAANARSARDVFHCAPSFDAPSLFPPTSSDARVHPVWNPPPSEKLVTKRFVIDESELARLRAPSAEDGRTATRVEAAAALIWRCAMRARRGARAERVSLALVVVDLRARAAPRMPETSFGNLCTYAAAAEVQAQGKEAKPRLEEKLRRAIKRVDGEHVRRLQGAHGASMAFDLAREAAREYGKSDEDAGDIDFYYFNSWARFPVYETDFGWGRPVWVGIARFFWKNLVLLMGRGGGGMEVWVTLEEMEMEAFERDEELVSFASTGPVAAAV